MQPAPGPFFFRNASIAETLVLFVDYSHYSSFINYLDNSACGAKIDKMFSFPLQKHGTWTDKGVIILPARLYQPIFHLDSDCLMCLIERIKC